MGQGTQTALAMMLAEELDADWTRVRTKRAPSEKAFANRFLARGLDPARLAIAGLSRRRRRHRLHARRHASINLQITGGSTAVRFTGQVGLRIVGAAAALDADRGRGSRVGSVSAARARRRATASSATPRAAARARYGELAAEAAQAQRAGEPALQAAGSDYKIVGTVGATARHSGQGRRRAMQYGIDVRLPGMLLRRGRRRHLSMAAGSCTWIAAPAMREIKGVERRCVASTMQSRWSRKVTGRRAAASRRSRRVFSDGGNEGEFRPKPPGAVQPRAGRQGRASESTRAATWRLRSRRVPANRIVEVDLQRSVPAPRGDGADQRHGAVQRTAG